MNEPAPPVSGPAKTGALPDLLAKIIIPVTLGLCTAYITSSNNAWTHRKECADRTLTFYQQLCPQGDCAANERKPGYVATRYSSDFLLERLCSKGAKDIDYKGLLQDLMDKSRSDAGIQANKSDPNAAPPPTTVVTAASSPTDKPVEQQASPRAPLAGHFNIYVQYHLAEQKSDVQTLVRSLDKASTQALQIKSLGPQLVPGIKIGTTQVRCFGDDTCKAAPDVAAYIRALTGQTVIIRDFSNLYPSTATKPLPLELWLSDAKITVSELNPEA